MSNRRKFLQQSAMLAMSGILYPRFGRANNLFGTNANRLIGVQLYTVGSLMEADAKGTLQKLAAIGIKELESAGSSKGNYYGYTPKGFAAMVKDMGMTWRSEHVAGFPITMTDVMKMAKTAADSAEIKKMAPLIEKMGKAPNLKTDTRQLADEAAEGGLSYMVCAGMPVSTMDEIKIAVDVLSKAGEICRKAGLQFAYHNHSYEFVPVNGVIPFDYIMSNTDKELVKSELDLGWAVMAGLDPVDIFKKYPGRIPLWHVKDMDKNTKTPTEIGSGFINFRNIFANMELSGMKHFFIEQDGAPKPLENVTNSYNAVNKILT